MLVKSREALKMKAYALPLRVRSALWHGAEKYHAADNFYCTFPDFVLSRGSHTGSESKTTLFKSEIAVKNNAFNHPLPFARARRGDVIQPCTSQRLQRPRLQWWASRPIDAEQSSPNVELTNDQAKKEVAEAERMIKMLTCLIQRGMKLKNFSDIESGRAVLAQARKKMAECMPPCMRRKKGRKLSVFHASDIHVLCTCVFVPTSLHIFVILGFV